MLKLIAILVLSGQLQVAVQQSTGYAEASFENSPTGAQALIAFAEKEIGDSPGGVRIVVGWVDEEAPGEHIGKALDDLGIKTGLVPPDDIQAAIAENQLTAPSARAVALADEKRFGFLYGRKKK
ncbi:MAG: hypothetical protein ABS43_07965 [Bordetella sp. SCN 67-23]|nr:hypothetical protein [Burkholderiales bacterium]ODS74819.1 MAG: hypothetical protein ABS43_07965 [Bordetella sp. SCN 67-23]OJW86453.1 MAG: hypothetical protein BGO71_14410 [Burkholderiales bacterium 67-32]